MHVGLNFNFKPPKPQNAFENNWEHKCEKCGELISEPKELIGIVKEE